MTDSAEVKEALLKLDRQVALSQRRAEQMQQLASDIEAIRVEISSPGGQVNVSVDANGRLLDVGFTHQAFVLGPDRVRSLLLQGLDEGYEEATRRSIALATDALGPDAPTVAGLRTNAERYRPQAKQEDAG
ncbi:YbaB/EbfC family nucleoid-associated protein [Microbacterium sp. SORGH_AS_0421]|uniref:YbaB/EbfC family nucleoid-associated protein n=1 Tax=Microbacterium sp. SORGH_AS_0421 TaxID=3041768 RepID=UPI0027945140|nr:YbaB/EbfC family nucleoid-associated protein [Microbacterium sp. SORGH_AS_0421]MDQ1176273.1 DNA-binding protein YbaB [Microbacterium sp. SORGH_AS_0421]